MRGFEPYNGLCWYSKPSLVCLASCHYTAHIMCVRTVCTTHEWRIHMAAILHTHRCNKYKPFHTLLANATRFSAKIDTDIDQNSWSAVTRAAMHHWFTSSVGFRDFRHEEQTLSFLKLYSSKTWFQWGLVKLRRSEDLVVCSPEEFIFTEVASNSFWKRGSKWPPILTNSLEGCQ